MARVNVYLPEELANAVKEAGLNVSGIAQDALSTAVAELNTDRWLDEVGNLPSTAVTHGDVIDAVRAARDELGS